MAELGQTTQAKALVPGEPAAVRETGQRWRNMGGALEEGADGLGKVTTEQGWSGQAAEWFRLAFSGEPKKWRAAADAFDTAAGAADGFAETLEWAQRQAVEAVALWERAEAATEQAQAAHQQRVDSAQQAAAAGQQPAPVPEFQDPGQEGRNQAQAVLARAREELHTAGEEAAAAVEAARDVAPPEPGFWGKVGESAEQFGIGAMNAVADTTAMAANLTHKIATDPKGFLTDAKELVQALEYGRTHPVQFGAQVGKAVIDYDTWKDNPFRAAGKLAPDAILTAVTGGGGAGARGARVAERTGDAVTDAARAGRAAETLQTKLDDLSGSEWSRYAQPGANHTLPAISKESMTDAEAQRLISDKAPYTSQTNEGAKHMGRGYANNCTACATTQVRRSRGENVSAAPTVGPQDLTGIKKNLGAQDIRVESYDEVIRDIREGGPGASGVVAIRRPGQVGHVINVQNIDGDVVFLDGQTGKLATLEGNVSEIRYIKIPG